MIVQDKAISDIKPYQKNPRHKYDINKVAQSIKEFGFQQPIVVDRAGVIIVGHGRYEAAKSLNLKTIPVTIADLPPKKAKAYRIADNKTNEYSDWDMGLLIQEFTDLLDINYDLELTGFDADELEKLIVGEKEGLTDEDAVPETPEEPKAQLGDIYKLGEHRLMCGDSTKVDDIDKLMEGTYPDLIHTDPPYGMNAVSKSGVLSKNYKTDIKGDDDNSIAKDCFNLVYGLFPKAKQIWWGANYYSSCLPDSECWLVWDKNNGNSDQTDCELAWANFRSVVRQFTQSSEKTNRVHPTQKPVSLMEWIIKRFKLNATTIADFFGGSGSTLIGAEKNKIKCYMMEFDPKFVDVIIKRWEQYTGQKAEKIN